MNDTVKGHKRFYISIKKVDFFMKIIKRKLKRYMWQATC